MIIILGLVILIAAVVVGVAGVLGNGGSGHALTHGFSVFGYHVTGSTGTLLLYGIVLGALAVLGLILLLAGARRTSRRGRVARRGLKQSRRETAAVSKHRDNLIEERDAARADLASAGAASTDAASTDAASTDAERTDAATADTPSAAPDRTLSGSRHLVSPDSTLSGRLRLLGRRFDPRPPAAGQPESLTREPAADVTADAPASDVPAPADESLEVSQS
jgi:Sec-independent protein translocase protein TatA